MVLLQTLGLVVIALIFLVKQRIPVGAAVMVVLGSGGHTGEMLSMLTRLDFDASGIEFVYGEGDPLSVARARDGGFSSSSFYGLPRARKVGQSMLTSVFSSLRTLFAALAVVWRTKPRLLLCNGPGTCVMVVLAARLLLLRTKVVYIESLARVKTLSLSGKLIYHLQLADKFVVQWPELAAEYPGVQLGGILV